MPHERLISDVISALGKRAMASETPINKTQRTLINEVCFLLSEKSLAFLKMGFKKSRVTVELEVSTRAERVDIEAASKRIRTTPIRASGRVF